MTARKLTGNEIARARTCFTNHLDYSRVRVHDRPWARFQPARTAMAPNGSIYFHAADHLADFSVNVASMAWLIYELTHCWQHQTGQWVMLRGAIERAYRYGAITAASRFANYSIEQQPSIVEDFYRLSNGLPAHRGSGPITAYQAIIPMLKPR